MLTPNNIRFHATQLPVGPPGISLQNRLIHFGAGAGSGATNDQVLIRVPIGEVDPHATIVITVGLDKSRLNTASVNSDPVVGISDGTSENLFEIVDANDYDTPNPLSPCYSTSGTHDGTLVSSTTQAPSKVTLTFNPFNKFGFCETAQEGGYINTAEFTSRIDITKPLFLTVKRSTATEEYSFHYFKVEIF